MTEFGREYGEGLYALCAEEKIEKDSLQALTVLGDAFKSNDQFIKLLSNMALSKEERVKIADDAFRGQIHEYLLNFIKIRLFQNGLFSQKLLTITRSYAIINTTNR